MKLRELTPEQLKNLYEQEMKRAFPPEELKPLKAMESLRDQGRYQTLGFWDGEMLQGYAFVWLEPGYPFVLLDYLGTVDGMRGKGIGSRMLSMLREHYAAYRGIFGEAEAPENGSPEGRELRLRRLEFYKRNGLRYGGYDCGLFGVHYQTLILGDEDVTAQELMQAHQGMYSRYLPQKILDRFVQIPLLPGQMLKSAPEAEEE